MIAEPMFLTRDAEKAGSGILDMMQLCREGNLPKPEFRQDGGQFVQTMWRPKAAVAPEVTPHVGTKMAPSRHQVDVLRKCKNESTLLVLMAASGRSDRTKYRHQVLNPLLSADLLEMTIPDKPTSSLQKYRLTEKGRAWLAGAKAGG